MIIQGSYSIAAINLLPILFMTSVGTVTSYVHKTSLVLPLTKATYYLQLMTILCCSLLLAWLAHTYSWNHPTMGSIAAMLGWISGLLLGKINPNTFNVTAGEA